MRIPPFLNRCAFSLLELLTAIAVVAALGVLVVGSMRTLGNRSDKLATIANWRQISVAIFSYVNDRQGALPGPLLSIQRAKYNASYTPGDLGYFLAPYLEPGLEGNGQRVGQTYKISALESPAMRKATLFDGDAKDDAMQFHMNITIYTEGARQIQPFGYRPSAVPVMRWAAVVQAFEQHGARLGDIPMFMMLDQDALGWNTATFASLGVPPQPLFGNSRLALFFDGHVSDYYPGVKSYPTTSGNGRSLSGDRP